MYLVADYNGFAASAQLNDEIRWRWVRRKVALSALQKLQDASDCQTDNR